METKIVLTDGKDDFDIREDVSDEELNTLNNIAFDATDGNLYWIRRYFMEMN